MRLISLLILLFSIFSYPCFAQDYWVYIRTYDRPGVTLNDDKGRSKKGDIVDIRYADYELSGKEQAEWKIIKVSGLTDEQIQLYKEPWRVETGVNERGQLIYKTLAYRRKKVNLKAIEVVPSVALKAILFTHLISDKTGLDLRRYKIGQKKYARFRWFRLFVSRLIKPAFAENVSTINWGSQDYDTLTLWEDAKDGDLVTNTIQETASCYDDDGDLDDKVSIDGSTTNTTYYMKITASSSERHNGTSASGFTINPSTDGSVITISDIDTILEWVVITGYTGAWTSGIEISEDCTLQSIVVGGVSGSDPMYGISGEGSDYGTYVHFYNNIVFDINGSAGHGRGIYLNQGLYEDYFAYNNTITGCNEYGYRQITSGISTNDLRNNLFKNNGIDIVLAGSETVTSTHNVGDNSASELAFGAKWSTGTADTNTLNTLTDSGATFVTDGVQAGSVVKNTTDTAYGYITAVTSETVLTLAADTFPDGNEGYEVFKNMYGAVTFVNEANDDFHLDGSDTAALDKGTDLTAIFTIDIDNETRTGTWDIGADEHVAAPSSFIPKITIL